ncbi:MAG: TetR/AcrR family transcriptional regulator [Clostridia bacterium]|nr:TetR/AcrR family transcriptional regulator [Clostridia bacterium]
MANVLYGPEELNTRVTGAARAVFLEKGLEKAEMNEIAARAGVSRSTLYRFAEDKERLAFMVASEIVTSISQRALVSQTGGTGFEKLAACIETKIAAYSQDLPTLRFLCEFDRRYSGATPNRDYAQDYEQQMQKLAAKSTQLLFEGVADGSIRCMENPMLFIAVLNETVMALLTREFVRDDDYLKQNFERNLGIIREAARILLASVKA